MQSRHDDYPLAGFGVTAVMYGKPVIQTRVNLVKADRQTVEILTCALESAMIGCADMRVDPANVFGLQPGEAVVMRNIGGRVTPGLLEQMSLLGRIGQVAG